MNELLINILSVVITSVVIPLITLVGAKLIKWLGTKTKDAETAKLINEAGSIIMSAVKSVFQTYVEALKKNGTFTVEAQQNALAEARHIALRQLSKETKAYITENYGDLNLWLTTQIEATINTLKYD